MRHPYKQVLSSWESLNFHEVGVGGGCPVGSPWKASRYTMLYVYVMLSFSGAPERRSWAIIT